MKLLEVGRLELENKYGARAEIYKSKNVYDKDVFIMDLMIKNEALPIPFYEIDKLNTYLKSLGFEDIIEKPFNLVEYLRENLKVKKFVKNEDNFYLLYDHKTERLEQQCNSYAELDGVCFNFISISVMEKLNEKKITIDQLKEAYKQLGWI